MASSMPFYWKGKEAQGNKGLFKVTHPLGTVFHSPISSSSFPSPFFFASSFLPFLLHFFLPWTILCIKFSVLRPLVNKVSTGQIWGRFYLNTSIVKWCGCGLNSRISSPSSKTSTGRELSPFGLWRVGFALYREYGHLVSL